MSVLQDGRIVSGSSDYTLRVWNISTGECDRVLKGHSDVSNRIYINISINNYMCVCINIIY